MFLLYCKQISSGPVGPDLFTEADVSWECCELELWDWNCKSSQSDSRVDVYSPFLRLPNWHPVNYSEQLDHEPVESLYGKPIFNWVPVT